ncbi:hypothetical protein GS399_01605 [Pedobacter sp. HMF7647]|uniref:Uncharacterized protein n=1 Tax=Hufsiella arboris TaxID=2695275 RepID=A0A7K1Y4Z1_9SPHI|nr:hypothetical protein [Hufsiella arboris]MXV49652.1 hypothetical protein [Hufsiella arboris]
MGKVFTTFAEMQAEIVLLKVKKLEQEEQIKEKFKSPGAILSTVTSLFKRSPGKGSNFISDLISQDFITSISRLVLPVFMNSFIFRKSNFITKAIVAFVSQRAAKNVDSHTLNNLVEKAKGLFSKFTSKKDQKPQSVKISAGKDYGIPPYSETY